MNNIRPSEYAQEIDNDFDLLEKSPPAEEIQIDDGTPVTIEMDEEVVQQNHVTPQNQQQQPFRLPEMKSTVSFSNSSSLNKSDRRAFCYSFGQPGQTDHEQSTRKYGPPAPLPQTISQHQEFMEPVSYQQPKVPDLIEFELQKDNQEERLPSFGSKWESVPKTHQEPHDETRFSTLFPSYPSPADRIQDAQMKPQPKRREHLKEQLDVSAMITLPSPEPLQNFRAPLVQRGYSPQRPTDRSAIIEIPQPADHIMPAFPEMHQHPEVPHTIEMPTIGIHRDQSVKSQKSSKSPSSSLYQSTEQQVKRLTMELTNVTIETSLQEVSKTFSYELTEYMQQYFFEEYKILLPSTPQSIFKMDPIITQQYLNIYAKFLLNYHSQKFIKFMKMEVQLTKKQQVQSIPIAWFNWAKHFVTAQFAKTKTQKLPVQKLYYFVVGCLQAQQKAKQARKLMKNVTGVEIQACPVQNMNYERQKKLLCLTQWLVGFERAQRNMQDRIQSLGSDAKNRAVLDCYNKLLRNYLQVKNEQVEACRSTLMQLSRQMLMKC